MKINKIKIKLSKLTYLPFEIMLIPMIASAIVAIHGPATPILTLISGSSHTTAINKKQPSV